MAISSITVPADYSVTSQIRRGADSAGVSQYDLFDKIINIKFKRKSGSSFVIRSDYEVKTGRDGRPYFARCQYKPQIHVTYKQVSNDKAIGITIRIANLFILNESAENSIFRYSGDPIIGAEIHMGYRQQFPDYTRPILNADTEESASPDNVQNRLKMFYNMTDFQITGTQDPRDTSLRQSIFVLGTYTEGAPPNNVIYIQGIVGTLDHGFAWHTDDPEMSLKDYFENEANFPRLSLSREGVTYTVLEKTLYTYITKRYLRTSEFQYILYDSDSDPNYVGSERKRTVQVLDYIDGSIDSSPEQLAKPVSDRWSSPLELENGLLSLMDAEALGVKCICSPGLMTLSQSTLVPRTGADGKPVGTPTNAVTDIPFQEYIGAQLDEIQDAYPDIRWYILNDGSFYFYNVNETATSIVTNEKDFQRSTLSKNPITLPAVYDISIGALRQIRCPFIGFVTFMQQVRFVAKYSLGTQVGFFYPHNKDDWFKVISVEVSFDTTGDENLMTLQCIDSEPPPEAAPSIDPAAALQAVAITSLAGGLGVKSVEWIAVPCGEIFTWPDGSKTRIPQTWESLATKFVLMNSGIDGAPGFTLTGMTLNDAVKKLLENADNRSNNDSWISDRPTLPASQLHALGFTSADLGMVRAGDTINVPMEKKSE